VVATGSHGYGEDVTFDTRLELTEVTTKDLAWTVLTRTKHLLHIDRIHCLLVQSILTSLCYHINEEKT
jgi:hypothetical protein